MTPLFIGAMLFRTKVSPLFILLSGKRFFIVVGFLNNRESLTSLVDLHRPVPRHALEAAVPRLVGLFDGVENAQVRQEWQKAIATLCLVLVVDAREQDNLTIAA